MTNNSFVENCNLTAATVPNVIFNPFCTSSKNRKTASKNFMPKASENNETKMSESMSKDSLEGEKHSGSSEPKSFAKIKAKFYIFLQRKSEVENGLDELLCSEKDDSVQPATIGLRATDLKARLSSLGIANWINSDLDQIDPT